jgi:hypothetical protein
MWFSYNDRWKVDIMLPLLLLLDLFECLTDRADLITHDLAVLPLTHSVPIEDNLFRQLGTFFGICAKCWLDGKAPICYETFDDHGSDILDNLHEDLAVRFPAQ